MLKGKDLDEPCDTTHIQTNNTKPMFIPDDIEYRSLPAQLEFFREEYKQQRNIIAQFESDFRSASDDILADACRRAAERMNKELKPEEVLKDDMVGDDFSFIEALSVPIHHFGYTLHEVNPYLPNYVSDRLEEEIDHLSSSDLFIIEHAECLSPENYDYHYRLLGLLESFFYGLLDDTYNSEKVQQYCKYL